MTSIKGADKESKRHEGSWREGETEKKKRKTAQQRRLNKIPIELMTIEIGFQL